MKDLTAIWKYVRKYFLLLKGKVIFYVLVSLLYAATVIFIPLMAGGFLDRLLAIPSIKFVVIYSVLFIILNLFNLLFMYFTKVRGTILNVDMSTAFKLDVLSHVQKISLTYTNQKEKASYAMLINNDAEYLIIFILNLLQEVIRNGIYFVVPFIFLFRIDKIIFLVSLSVLVFIYFTVKYYDEKSFNASLDLRNKMLKFFEKVEEQIFNLKVIKINQIEDILEKKYNQQAKEQRKSYLKNEKVLFVYRLFSSNMDVFLRVFLFVYGGISIINKRMTVGEFVIMNTFLSLSISAFTYFLYLNQNIQVYKAFYVRLKNITDIPVESFGKEKIEGIEAIQVSNLKFAYEEKEILTGFEYEFKKDNIYSIVGENGSGKSTLLGLLLGLYIDEYNGKIAYNGISIRKLDIPYIRKEYIGVSEQEPELLNDTIGFNITFATRDKRDVKKMEEVIDAVSLEEFLFELEDGLGTIINTCATNLSGGQKQKISIAKALYKNPDLIILDEPTSALDEKSKEKFISYLSKIKKNKIIILVTHDKEFLEISDEVIQLS